MLIFFTEQKSHIALDISFDDFIEEINPSIGEIIVNNDCDGLKTIKASRENIEKWKEQIELKTIN